MFDIYSLCSAYTLESDDDDGCGVDDDDIVVTGGKNARR